MLLDRTPEVRQAQFGLLDKLAEADVVRLTRQLLPFLDGLDVRARLPLVDLTLPALRSLSITQYRNFATCFDGLIKADDRLDLFEWTLSRVLMRHLQPQFDASKAPPIRYYALNAWANQFQYSFQPSPTPATTMNGPNSRFVPQACCCLTSA